MSSPSRISRTAALLGLALMTGSALTVQAATSGPEGVPGLQPDIMGPALTPGSTIAGRFLAARHAEVVGDLVAAADMTSEIFDQVPETETSLRRAHLLRPHQPLHRVHCAPLRQGEGRGRRRGQSIRIQRPTSTTKGVIQELQK